MNKLAAKASIALLCFLSACGVQAPTKTEQSVTPQFTRSPLGSSGSEAATTTPVTAVPTGNSVVATSSPKPTEVITPAPTATPKLPATQAVPVVSAPGGILFQTDDGTNIWRTEQGNKARLLFSVPEMQYAVLDRMGARAAWILNNEVWIFDSRTQTKTKVEGTKPSTKTQVKWAGTEDQYLLVSEALLDQTCVETCPAIPNLVDLRSGKWFALSSEPAHTPVSVSPDGKRIVFETKAKALWLYTLGGSAQNVKLDSYIKSLGASARITDVEIASPAYSPDGTQIAMNAVLRSHSQSQLGILVINTNSGKARFLLPSEPELRQGWFVPPRWSPDGRWLVGNLWGARSRSLDKSVADTGYYEWVVNVDDASLATPLCRQIDCITSEATWNPEGTTIVFDQSGGGTNSDRVKKVFDLRTRTTSEILLPSDSILVGWRR